MSSFELKNTDRCSLCVLSVNNAYTYVTRVSHYLCSSRWRPAVVWNFRVYSKKFKSLRSLSKLLTVENGHGLCVFSMSNDHLVQDISLEDKGAADFQVINKMPHNLRHFWAVNQTRSSFPRKTGFVRQCFTHTVTKTFYVVKMNYTILHLKYELEWNYSET
jgi:hypothetical protein